MIRVTPDGHEIEFDTHDEQRRILTALQELDPTARSTTAWPGSGEQPTIVIHDAPADLLHRVVARVEWTRKVVEAADRFAKAATDFDFAYDIDAAAEALRAAAKDATP